MYFYLGPPLRLLSACYSYALEKETLSAHNRWDFVPMSFILLKKIPKLKNCIQVNVKFPMFSSSVNALDEKWLALVTCYPNLNFTQEPLGGMYMSP